MNQYDVMLKLLFTNVPIDCVDEYLWQWVEARGYRVSSLKLIRDQVSGTSPSFAHVQLMNPGKIDEAVRFLNGQDLCGRRIQVACIKFKAAVAGAA
jgi:hypothetical protein